MHDVTLLKKLGTRKDYTRLSGFIKEHAVSKETWHVMKCLGIYFRSYSEVIDVNWDDFQTFFFTSSKLSSDEHTIYADYFDRCKEEDKDSVVVEDVLKNYVTKDYATQIMNKSMEVLSGREEVVLDDVTTIMAAYRREVGRSITKEDLFVPADLTATLTACSTKGFEWRLEELNVAAGPLRDGDFVVLAARPETGKTTFIASEVSFFATQLADDTRPIVWVNNEEASNKVMSRVMQAYFGVPIHDLIKDSVAYSSEYAAKIGGRIRIINDNMGLNDVKHLSALFEEVNPCMIVFDQLDKVYGFDRAEREDLRIGSLYEWGRSLAKKYGPTIAVSQASEVGDHVSYIDMNMLRGSKTDKAGEADLIITLGKDKDVEYKRYLYVPKNKLYGGSRSVESLRHGKFEITIHPEIARYSGTY